MELLQMMPILYTSNLDAAINFYSNWLGFKLMYKNDTITHAFIHQHNYRIMLRNDTHKEIYSNEKKRTHSLYFEVKDVAVLYKHLYNHVKVAYELKELEWGVQEFGIYDLDGHLLQFGSAI